MSTSARHKWASSDFEHSSLGMKRKRSVQDEALRLMLGHIHVRKAGGLPSTSSPSASSSSSPWLTCQPQQWRVDELDLDVAPSPGWGWEKCLDLQTGKFYFVNRNTGSKKQYLHTETSDLDNAKATELQEKSSGSSQPSEAILNLDLNLGLGSGSSNREARTKDLIDVLPISQFSSLTSDSSPPHSGVSFEDATEDLYHRNLPQPAVLCAKKEDAVTLPVSPPPALVTVGCSKCLMFVMLPQDDPRCPRCGNCALLGLPNLLDSFL